MESQMTELLWEKFRRMSTNIVDVDGQKYMYITHFPTLTEEEDGVEIHFCLYDEAIKALSENNLIPYEQLEPPTSEEIENNDLKTWNQLVAFAIKKALESKK